MVKSKVFKKNKVSLVSVEDCLVIGIRGVGSYSDISLMIKTLRDFLDKYGSKPVGPPMFLCHELSCEEANEANGSGEAELEVCFPVKEEFELDDEAKGLGVEFFVLKGGLVVKVVHKGGYKSINSSYQALFDWVSVNEKSITGPVREIFISVPKKFCSKNLLTELYAPIE